MYNLSTNDKEVLKTLAKRRNIYTIIFVVFLVAGGTCGVIPTIGWYLSMAFMVLWGVFAGLGMLCINYSRFVKSGGRKQGGGLWWLILFVFGLFVIPVLTVFVCNHCSPLAQKVLGVTFVDRVQNRKS